MIIRQNLHLLQDCQTDAYIHGFFKKSKTLKDYNFFHGQLANTLLTHNGYFMTPSVRSLALTCPATQC